MRIYGTMQCPDCVECCKDLDASGIHYTFLEFSDNLKNLKEFLKIRDGSDLFDDARASGKIGIPCLIREDGSFTLEWEEFLK